MIKERLVEIAMITFSDYSVEAKKTAQYPRETLNEAMSYLLLGLTGEAGEMANKYKKILRKDQVLTPEFMVKFMEELGDVLWYCAMIAEEFDVSLAQVAQNNMIKLADRADRNQIKGSGDNR